MNHKLTLCLLLSGLLSGWGYAEQVLLRGGTKVDAPIVKKDGRMTVLDLGFDLLRIPHDEILRITSDVTDSDKAEETDAERLYVTRRMERMSTSTASSMFSSSVVLVRTPSGSGSGFFVNKDGFLLTNFHVIAGEKKITVTQYVQEGTTLKREVYRDVEIVATAPFHDLSVLRVKELKHAVEPVVFAPEDIVTVGETVFAIGNPMGLERTLTEGVISQTGRLFEGIIYLQLDAPVNPGNSGGPLFNSRGQVIGIINMGAPWMEGLNFAIPVQHARYVLDHISSFAYDPSNSTSGYVYPAPPRRSKPGSVTEKDNNKEK